MSKKSVINGSDYKCVNIAGSRSPVRVHRIVCETFHGKAPKARPLVNHSDEHKDNNSAANLSWVSQKENISAYFQNHTLTRHPISTIKTVKRLLNRGWTNDRIAQQVKMSDSNVSGIKLGHIHVDVLPYTVDQWL